MCPQIFKAKLFPGKFTFSSVLIPSLYSVLLFLGPLPIQEREMPTSLLSVKAWAEAQVAQSLPATARVKRKLVYSRCHIPYNPMIREHLDHTSQKFTESLDLPLFDAHSTLPSPELSCPNSYHNDILPKL